MSGFARSLVLSHGWNSTCYQILNPGIRLWSNRENSAVAGYVDCGGYRVVAGAPVCPDETLMDVVAELRADAIAEQRRLCFFGAEARLLTRLRASGSYTALPIGAQPVWHLDEWEETVGRTASIRAQINRARNKGVVVSEWPWPRAQNHAELRRCLLEWLSSRGLPPMRFMVEPNTLSDLQDRRIFVASMDSRPTAYLVASPVPRRNGWLVEQIVRGEGAVNGTGANLIDSAFRHLARSGGVMASLGLAPLSPRGQPEVDAPMWFRTATLLARRFGSRFYGFQGIEQFKARFRPSRWEPVYLIINEPRLRQAALCAVLTAFAPNNVGSLAPGRVLDTIQTPPTRIFRRDRQGHVANALHNTAK